MGGWVRASYSSSLWARGSESGCGGETRLAEGVGELRRQRIFESFVQRRVPHGKFHRDSAEVHRVRREGLRPY